MHSVRSGDLEKHIGFKTTRGSPVNEVASQRSLLLGENPTMGLQSTIGVKTVEIQNPEDDKKGSQKSINSRSSKVSVRRKKRKVTEVVEPPPKKGKQVLLAKTLTHNSILSSLKGKQKPGTVEADLERGEDEFLVMDRQEVGMPSPPKYLRKNKTFAGE